MTESLIVGAPPHAERAPSLTNLLEQCTQRGVVVGCVVSCLELDEAVSSPLLAEVAQPRDWERILNVTTFLNSPFPHDPRATVDVPYSDVLDVCNQMHRTVTTPPRNKVVFLHCKTGKRRSWILAMCYLISQLCLTYGEAEQLLRSQRRAFEPSDVQVDYVKGFETFVGSPQPMKTRSSDEAKYLSILTELLSLPSEYRQRIISDIEKLT